MRNVTRRALRRLRLLALLLAVSAFLFLLPSRFTAPMRVLFNEASGPLQSAAFRAAGDALATGGTLSEMFLKEDRERALARELVRLRNENARLADDRRRLVLRMASLEKATALDLPVRVLRAPVAAYDASGMRRAIAVRAGRADGVEPGMAVTSQGGLVGVVVEAGRRRCRVRLITDPHSALPCRLSRTRRICILQGTGGETCRVDWLDRESFVEAGDVLVTASLEAAPRGGLRLPDGVPAVTVTRVERDPMRPLFMSVEGAPHVNLERLEEVEVLIPEES